MPPPHRDTSEKPRIFCGGSLLCGSALSGKRRAIKNQSDRRRVRGFEAKTIPAPIGSWIGMQVAHTAETSVSGCIVKKRKPLRYVAQH